MTPLTLLDWASRWGIPAGALSDLAARLTHQYNGGDTDRRSEAYVQSEVRLDEAKRGNLLWRNNVGVLRNERGTPVRYGLANDSPALNAKLKSSDLIGLTPVTIEPHMVGSVIGQFTALETKHAGWKYSGDDREAAQAAFLQLVVSHGGRAAFTTGPGVV
jgi:hypothetical protein